MYYINNLVATMPQTRGHEELPVGQEDAKRGAKGRQLSRKGAGKKRRRARIRAKMAQKATSPSKGVEQLLLRNTSALKRKKFY